MRFLDISDIEADVVLQCFQRLMTEHPADVIDIGVTPDQLTGAASAEDVRGQRLFQAGLFACFENDTTVSGFRGEVVAVGSPLSRAEVAKPGTKPGKAGERKPGTGKL